MITNVRFLILFFVVNTATNSLLSQQFSVNLLHPKQKSQISVFQKVELGIGFPDSVQNRLSLETLRRGGLNPFDANEVHVEAVFLHTDGTMIRRDGFAYVPYRRNEEAWEAIVDPHPFRIRTVLPQAGEWKATITVAIYGNEVFQHILEFQCKENDEPGHVVAVQGSDPSNRYLRFSKTRKAFIPVGENLGWVSYDFLKPSDASTMFRWMDELSGAGGNFFRIWMKPAAYGIEWEHLGFYGNRMPNAWELDQVLEYAEQKGLYMQLLLLIDEFGPANGWPDMSLWKNNPYHTQLGIQQPIEFLSDSVALEYMKRRLRYVEARWGYSPHLAVYELVSEPERLFGYHDNNSEHRKSMINWINTLHGFLRDELSSVHPTLVSFMLEGKDAKKRIWQATKVDVAGINQYGRHHGENYKMRAGIVSKVHKARSLRGRPFQFTEMGVAVFPTMDYCSSSGFHNAIWATLFMGGMGTGLNWWWDNAIHPQGYYTHFKALMEASQRLDPIVKNYDHFKGKNKCTYGKATLEYYVLASAEKDEFHAWVHNNTWWWYRMRSENQCIEEMISNQERRFDKADQTNYEEGMPGKFAKPPVLLQDEKFSMKLGKANTRYQISWFDAHGEGHLISQDTARTNTLGKIKLTFPQNKLQTDPDYMLSIKELR